MWLYDYWTGRHNSLPTRPERLEGSMRKTFLEGKTRKGVARIVRKWLRLNGRSHAASGQLDLCNESLPEYIRGWKTSDLREALKV